MLFQASQFRTPWTNYLPIPQSTNTIAPGPNSISDISTIYHIPSQNPPPGPNSPVPNPVHILTVIPTGCAVILDRRKKHLPHLCTSEWGPRHHPGYNKGSPTFLPIYGPSYWYPTMGNPGNPITFHILPGHVLYLALYKVRLIHSCGSPMTTRNHPICHLPCTPIFVPSPGYNHICSIGYVPTCLQWVQHHYTCLNKKTIIAYANSLTNYSLINKGDQCLRYTFKNG